MKLPFKYDMQIIEKAVENQFGFVKIDLGSPENVEYIIKLILDFLELDKVILVQNTFGAIYSDKTAYEERNYLKVRFTLVSSENTNNEQFQKAIIKVQDFFNIESKGNKTETEKAIDNILKIISNIESSKFEFYIGITYSEESAAKAKCNLPKYWYFYKASEYEYASELYNFFIRKGYKNNEGSIHRSNTYEKNVYFYAKEKN